MPTSLIAIPYTILEISTFLGQLPIDDDDSFGINVRAQLGDVLIHDCFLCCRDLLEKTTNPHL